MSIFFRGGNAAPIYVHYAYITTYMHANAHMHACIHACNVTSISIYTVRCLDELTACILHSDACAFYSRAQVVM